jgi:hypothetical protein
MPYSNISLVTDPNLLFQQYDFIQLSHDANNYIIGRVVSYNPNSGEIVFTPLQINGSGTYSSWNISLTGSPGPSGTSGLSSLGPAGSSGTSGSSNLPASTGWNIESEYQISSNEQLTFSGDYVLEDSNLYIEGSNEQVEYSANKFFKKTGKIFIGGNLLLKNSQIENDGEISVGGQIILIDDSQITGTGTII